MLRLQSATIFILFLNEFYKANIQKKVIWTILPFLQARAFCSLNRLPEIIFTSVLPSNLLSVIWIYSRMYHTQMYHTNKHFCAEPLKTNEIMHVSHKKDVLRLIRVVVGVGFYAIRWNETIVGNLVIENWPFCVNIA